ncbi:MAG: FadR/GntR family transcriptional regulator [Pseudotabrizicola sp.]|uniref:FadR/GntR family transcriptional regulator n=1 Tax=Pseudotabrizicola sp. TaxID=2939647 RepID=UPI002730E3AC|nr:FadR/GntR family transcriptional regulator [Pseudotabrizicola sp.]MDP2080223.1 FadR/GntR family transcriptional regulator [Pseudotabrizicola sp.]MDZ7575308.1 FadR/GntR family transcriptional regulator [Pseudotabrizicola sp.]
MTATERREPTLADQVYDRLLSDIVEGRYPLQSRLPAEEALAQTCGVSRPVLRAALARLRDDGMISSRRGSGNYVARRPDRSVMQFVPLGSITDIQRCYEFRADVESAAAGWAAQRRDDSDLAALEQAHQHMETSYLQQALGVDADQLLHVSIARATKNPFYQTVLESLSQQITFGMQLSRSLTLQAAPDRQAIVQAEHRAIIDAIRDQSPEAAAAAMRRHIMGARDRMFVGQAQV